MREKSQAKQIGARARSAALPPEVRSRMAAKAALKKAGYPSATHTTGSRAAVPAFPSLV